MATSPVRAYIGLGGNVGDRLATLRRAAELLDAPPILRVVRRSPVLEYPAWGPVAQGPYLNAVVGVDALLPARALLDRLMEIERSLGRDRAREQRWGPRTLDLDLLIYGESIIDEPGLRVPHPWLAKRRFVLEPLAAIAPGLRVPEAGATVADLAARAEGDRGAPAGALHRSAPRDDALKGA